MDDEYMDRVYDNHLAARAEQREAEGRCGTCGAFNGPDHECPHLIALQRKIASMPQWEIDILRDVPLEDWVDPTYE